MANITSPNGTPKDVNDQLGGVKGLNPDDLNDTAFKLVTIRIFCSTKTHLFLGHGIFGRPLLAGATTNGGRANGNTSTSLAIPLLAHVIVAVGGGQRRWCLGTAGRPSLAQGWQKWRWHGLMAGAVVVVQTTASLTSSCGGGGGEADKSASALLCNGSGGRADGHALG
jgi:hypothetical protein